jgi:cell division transport system permease protein
MNFLQALRYFTREAILNLARGWRVSLLAMLTIAVSLFLAGFFLLVSGNLHRIVKEWQDESKVVVYLEAGILQAQQDTILQQAGEHARVRGVSEISAEEARLRFVETFPSMADLLEGWGEEPLPVSFEIAVDRQDLQANSFDSWLQELRAQPGVFLVDDDRDWLVQVQAIILVLNGLGLVLGAILLGTAIFTISSVIRLTAYLYRDEISVMRLVGATEFFIRGPFYAETLIQGIAGGFVAVSALFAAHQWVIAYHSKSMVASILVGEFLTPLQLAGIVMLGALAGLMGALTSLKREVLGHSSEPAGWTDG